MLAAATFEEEGRVPTALEAVRGVFALCQELRAALLRIAEAVDGL